MGTWHMALASANRIFGPELIDQLDATELARCETFADALRTAGVGEDDEFLRFVDSWPPAKQGAIRGAVRAALRAEPRMYVGFAWVRSPVHEVTVFETPGDGKERGEVTILIKGPV